MTLVGDSNVHIVGNVTGRVFGAVNVEDRNGVAQGLERELLFLSPSLINKDYICAAVQQGIHGDEGPFVLWRDGNVERDFFDHID